MGKIGEWKASYYCNGTKTWIYGRLIVYTRCIRFVEDKEGTTGVDFRIDFEDFFELKKETTSIFFAAITVCVRSEKYWFSSFTDRGYVFNTIEHFWKERLFARCVEFFADRLQSLFPVTSCLCFKMRLGLARCRLGVCMVSLARPFVCVNHKVIRTSLHVFLLLPALSPGIP